MIKPLSDKKNVVFGVVLTYVSLAVSLVGSLFVTPIVLNNIGDSNYGLLSFCNSLTSWLSLISSSLGASYIFFATKDRKENGNERKTNTIFCKTFIFIAVLIVALVSVLLLILRAAGFQLSNYNDEQNGLIYILLLISTIQVSISIAFYAFSLNNQYTKSFALSKGLGVALSILTYVLNILVAIITKSIVLIAAVSVFSSLFSGIIHLFYAIRVKNMRFERARLKGYGRDALDIFKYSSIILISTIIANLDSNLDKTLLGIMVDGSAVTMYQLSISFSTHLIVAAYAFTEVTRPTLYALYREGRGKEANELFLKITKIQSIVVLLLIFGYISCGYHFTISWVGKERIDVFFYSAALFVCQIVPISKSISTEVYRANNMHKVPTLLALISIIINLGLSIALLLMWDKQMAVWACVIGTIVPRILFTWIINPIVEVRLIHTPIKKYYLSLLKDVLLAVVACIPSISLCLILDGLEISNILKILIEGLSFVAIYSLEMLVFERKTISYYWNTFVKKKSKATVM